MRTGETRVYSLPLLKSKVKLLQKVDRMTTLECLRKFIGVAALLGLTTGLLVPFTLAQSVTTVAGGFVGDGQPATKASFQIPYEVVRDKTGNTYVSDPY